MKYIGLANYGGMPIYSIWLLPDGTFIHVDLDMPGYFEHIAMLREKYGEI